MSRAASIIPWITHPRIKLMHKPLMHKTAVRRASRALPVLLLCIFAALMGHSRQRTLEDPGSGRISIYRGYKIEVLPDGDTMTIFVLQDLDVYATPPYRNEKERKEWDRLVYNVKRTLPYAKLISETLLETYEYLETFPTDKERDAYLKKMEKSLFEQYKPVLRKLSKNQAKLLVKLVQRETNQSSYDIVKAFLGSFRAGFWQGFGKLFGVSLKSNYNPQGNKEDARIERVARGVERGLL